jgi:hypothetical protein
MRAQLNVLYTQIEFFDAIVDSAFRKLILTDSQLYLYGTYRKF